MDTLDRGRAAVQARSWGEAFELLSEADTETPLGVADLELAATASYMVGRDPDLVRFLERAHQGYLQDDAVLQSVRSAFWIGVNLALRGEWETASGWFGRAHRLLERHEGDSAEAGYLMVMQAIQAAMAGDHVLAFRSAAEAIEIGQRFAEHDLVALAVFEQGRARMREGRMQDGLRLLDEAMVAVLADDLSPFVSGLIYCGVIEGCHSVHALRRAHRWTGALTEWCDNQEGIVAFTGQCLTHRAELLQLRGDWTGAMAEAQQASTRFREGMNQFPAANAFYRQGELYRLRGEVADAEEAYRSASRWGWSPQPGLALLRMDGGGVDAAAVQITTSIAEAENPVDRARLLPAAVEIHLAAGNLEAAAQAVEQLDAIVSQNETETLTALADHARGLVLLATDMVEEAIVAFGKARGAWVQLDAPYEAAVARVGVARAALEMGDEERAQIEASEALAVFERLGAAPAAERARSLIGGADDQGPLTSRELEVLALVASGSTNREVAAELVLSERTVDRHVSNILTKLGVSSRTAATTYAYEHRLL